MKIILEWRAGYQMGTKRVEFPYNEAMEFSTLEGAANFVEANQDIKIRWYVGNFITPELEAQVID